MEEHNLAAAKSNKRTRHTVNHDREIAPICTLGIKQKKKKRKKKTQLDVTIYDNLNPSISISKPDHDATLVGVLVSCSWYLCHIVSKYNLLILFDILQSN
jgi:hypothetical protein